MKFQTHENTSESDFLSIRNGSEIMKYDRYPSEIGRFELPDRHLILSSIVPFIDNNLSLAVFPETKPNEHILLNRHKHNVSMNINEDILRLMHLYNDIQSTNNMELNVNWKKKDYKENKERITQQMLSVLPTPNYQDLTKLLNALHTTYHQCIYGESPRIDGIEFVHINTHNKDWIKRDKELQTIYDDITKNNNNNIEIKVCCEQYENNKTFEKAIKAYIAQNNEYNVSPFIVNYGLQSNVLEIFHIKQDDIDASHHGILLKQRGLRSKVNIGAFVVIGQYFGNEICSAMMDKKGTEIKRLRVYDAIFASTSAQDLHHRYSFDHKVQSDDYDFEFVLDPLPLNVENEHDLNAIQSILCPLVFINDCRSSHNMQQTELTEKDEKYKNIEYVQCYVNGWSHIYVITTKDISQNEQFWGYYGNDLSKQINNEYAYKQHTQQLKARLDAKHDILHKINTF